MDVEPVSKLKLTWKKYLDDIKKLYKLINFEKYDTIVAINRGGLLIGLLFSHWSRKPLKVVDKFELVCFRGRLLIVDDVSDTGDTLLRVIANLKTHSFDTATVFVKPWSKYRPTFWVKETNKWIVYPYEIDEN
jgi:hypoxanthine phosphoribosyltransferase